MRKCTNLMVIMLVFAAFTQLNAQAPSHDPTAMFEDGGRYHVFTTGDGIWNMSASNTDFTDWVAEDPVFPTGTWPSWINNYVPDFSGDFWAPGMIEMGGYYYLYYSCSSFGSSQSAIGVVRTSSLTNPNWEDQGMVVYSDGSDNAINAIDPALFRDTDGKVYMTYGSWFGGIGIIEIDPNTGKTIGNLTQIAGGGHMDIEAPYIIENNGEYYLFVNRGKCCDGVESTYWIEMAKADNPTGPYSGWQEFLPNQDGNIIGPGHIGDNEGKLTYHFYDGNDNGNAKLLTTTLGWNNGWPVAGGTGDGSSGGGGGDGTYQLRNRGTGMYLDGMGRTNNGDAVGQYANTSHPNAQWELIDAGSSYYYIQNVGTGMKIDGYGRTENGADVAQYANTTTHVNAQWSVDQYDGSYYRIQNRGTGLFLDGMGRTTNGEACGQYANTTHVNAQWELISVNSAQVEQNSMAEKENTINVYPNPAIENINVSLTDGFERGQIAIYNNVGQLVVSRKNIEANTQTFDISKFSKGMYIVQVSNSNGSDVFTKKFSKE